jgi:penicillin amidase
MSTESREALIFNAWMREASRLIFKDELGESLMADYWEQRNMHQSMVNVLKNIDGQAGWCGELLTSRAAKTAECGTLLSKALGIALSDLEARYGEDMTDWKWGVAHMARSEHRPFGKVGWLSEFFDIRVPAAGDTYTVNVGRYNLRDEAEPFTSRHAAGLRALYDLSDLENSRFIHSTGQSGHALSPFYRNFAARWANGVYIPMRMKRDEVEKEKLGTLRLEP